MACKGCGNSYVWADALCVYCFTMGAPERADDELGLGVAADAHVDVPAEKIGETVDVKGALGMLEVGGHMVFRTGDKPSDDE